MNFPWTLVVTLSLLLGSFMAYSNPSLDKNTNSTFAASDDLIQQRLKNIDSPVAYRYEPAVTAHVKSYLIQGKHATQRILGRTALYFPVFEHYLNANRLPEQLKYLPIVESRLQPSAKSYVGALGLWQFTAATARQYHLTINGDVDERRDPIRSTEAAVNFLAQLYGKYRDWALVLAAYNCGPARVNQAIRTAGGVRNYWKIRQYLPKETQDYVPRFMAVTYIMNHYHDHYLVPSYPSYQLQLTRTVKIFNGMNFQDIARLSGVSTDVVATLNPAYFRGYIPANSKGHYLILPVKAMDTYKSRNAAQVVAVNFRGSKRTHVVESGDTIESIAKKFRCSVKDIQYWNNMKQDALYFRQEVVIYTGSPMAAGTRS
ncbi:MAG: transglycosylase SLT domain-containing protein [Bacteroidota bacterium]